MLDITFILESLCSVLTSSLVTYNLCFQPFREQMTRIMLPAERHAYPPCRAGLGQWQDRWLCVWMALYWTRATLKTLHYSTQGLGMMGSLRFIPHVIFYQNFYGNKRNFKLSSVRQLPADTETGTLRVSFENGICSFFQRTSHFHAH